MAKYIISIDQSTQGTKALPFSMRQEALCAGLTAPQADHQ